MKFKIFAEFLQQLESEPSRNAMTKILAELFEHCSAQEIKIVCYFCSGSLYAAYADKQFNIASKGIMEILAQFLNLSTAAIQKDFKKLGDFGLVVQEAYHGQDQGLTVSDVYNHLIVIADITGTGSTEKKYHQVCVLLKQLDPIGAKFVVRIISKTLRLGFSDMTILDALSWMQVGNKQLTDNLEHAYNICADIGLVAQIFKQHGISGIENMQIHIGIPIRPAAAERLKSARAVVEKLGSCVAQPKLDGFRVQVHVKKSESSTQVHFFSRNLLDMSDMFPELKKLVSHLHVKSLICEGEAIVYDQESETFLPFQQTVKRKRKHDIDQASQDLPLRLYLFDILYLDGHSLLDKTHQQRRVALQKVLHNVREESLQIIDEKKINTASELEHYFLQNIQAGLEGLVVKRSDSIYQPGKRNFNWIKLKRESHATLIDTVDVVILGYYTGEGKRAKFGIGAFLVGVYDQHHDRFETVAKVGTGMSDDEWKALKKRCDALKVGHQPKNVFCSKELYPDVWVEPEMVCSVKADEITWSPLHTAGKTEKQLGLGLRFPRFIQYREDKKADSATTVSELHTLFQQQKVKS